MKNIIKLFLVSLALLIIATGCNIKNYSVNEKTNEDDNIPASSKKEINDNTTADIKAVYLTGKYNEELNELQNRNKEAHKVYYCLIEDKEELDKIQTKYELVLDNIGSVYNRTEEFFKNNMIIAIFPEQVLTNIKFSVKDITEQKNAILVKLEKKYLGTNNSDIVNRAIFIEIKKELWGKWQNVHIDVFDKNELTMEDLQLGELKLRLSEEELQNIIKEKPKKIIKKSIDKELIYENGTQVIIRDWEVFKIFVTSEKYVTPRGLKVGDSVQKLIQLYGEPSQVIDNKDESKLCEQIYSYDLAKHYYLFHVGIKDGKIVSIEVHLGC